MTDKTRHIDFYPDEWLAGTGALDPAECGIYITACALIYSHGGAIPFEELRARCRCHGHAFNRAYNHLLRLGKLQANDGQIDNKRCANELQKANKRIVNAQQNGNKSHGRPRKINGLENPTGISAEKLTTNYQLPTTNQEGSVGKEPTGAVAPSLSVVAGIEHRPETVPAPVSPHDPKKELYTRGRQVLGKSCGGQITKLIALHEGDFAAAKYTLEQAAEAAFPAEYLGKILSGERNAPMDYDAFYRSHGLSEDEYRAVH